MGDTSRCVVESIVPEQLLLLSAAAPSDLKRYAGALARRLDGLMAGSRPAADVLADAAYTLQVGRTAMPHRLAVTAADPANPASAIEALQAFADGRPAPDATAGSAAGPAPASAPRDPESLAEAVRAWLAGADLDWSTWWSTRRSRLSLPAPARWTAPDQDQNQNQDQDQDQGPERDPETADAIATYLVELWAELAGIDPGTFDARSPLADIGLSSFVVTRMNARLQADLGERDRTLFFSHSDLASVAATLADRHPDPRRPSAITSAPATGVTPDLDPGDQIAIIGMAGVLPGARTLAEYWANLRSGRDCVSRIPDDRVQPGWPADQMWGGFIDGVADFDPLLFAITPRDAELMDPQERLFLQTAWECLEDAGYTRARLRERHDNQVGVFVGAMHNEYPYFGVERSQAGPAQDTGATLAGIANRVSFFFDFHGPSLSVDTMCSSSLTAIHLALQSLCRGEAETAIVGATNLSLHPNKYVQQHRMQLAATDHHCRSFGVGGDGFVPAEAVIAIMLKPLAAAVADGDRVHAVIAGSSVVHAGRTNGYLVPNPVAQGDMVARAWRDAGLDPADIGYLEAHGAGTALGDPVEIAGLLRVFGSVGLAPGSVPIGSVKSCLGHAESAAGLAALLKVVLQLRHGELAPTLHAQPPNPEIDWDAVPFRVQSEPGAWERRDDRPRRAGISSFGAGGAIAHVVLEEFTGAVPTTPNIPNTPNTEPARPRQLVVLSGRDDQALRRAARRLGAALRALPADGSGDPGQPSLADIAYTLQVGREPLRERLAIVADSIAEVIRRLDDYLEGDAEAVLRGAAGPARDAARTRAWSPDADLDELARGWVSGDAVDWEAGRTRPPGQLVDLPHYPFEAVRCWLPGAPADQPAPSEVPPSEVSLYERDWTPTDAAAGTQPPAGRVLCVYSRHSGQVARVLRETIGSDAVLACEGEVSDTGHLGFVRASEAVRLVQRIREDNRPVIGWIDIADLDRPAAEAGLWRARLAALQELVSGGSGHDVRVLHVRSSGPDSSRGPDGVPGSGSAVVSGVVRALAAEGSVAAARSLVLDGPAAEADHSAAQILSEWCADSPYPEARHRSGQRYRPALTPAGPSTRSLPVSPDVSYVIAGGTSGIGARIARWLVDRGARRLALTGRTDLDDTSEAAVRRLREAGAEVLVHTGSVADRAAMAAFFASVRSELGPIDGIIHCAGRSDQPVSFAAKDFATDGAASTVLEPKVEGFEVLREVTTEDHPSFAVLFSSICAVVPSMARGVSAYAAANSYLESAAIAGACFGDRPVQSVAWPQWAESGRSAGQDNVCAALGVGTLTDDEGLSVLAAVISRPQLRSAVPLPHTAPLDLDALLATPPAAAPQPSQAPQAPQAPQPSEDSLAPAWLVQIFSEALHLPADRLDHDTDFGDLGVESIMLGELLRAIERHLDRSLSPGLLLDYPTLRSLAGALGVGAEPDQEPDPEPPKVTAAAPSPSPSPRSGRVAIIGAACRFPDAPDLQSFWDNLVKGHNAVREVPPSRWDHRVHYRPKPETGYSISKWGGFVDGLEDFDPAAFGMNDDEARALDPAIRLTLETTHACLADAGYDVDELAGRPAGVFVGARLSRYGDRVGVRAHGLRSDQNFITAYVAQHFDLRGPNMVVDSACSSSLVSLQLAMRSLREGECEVAVAGGVEILLDEADYIDLSAAGALSPSGRCATFDESADGFVPGEGCGLVVLKPLEAALADGDRIRAVIDAIAVNNDGRTMGVTTPSREGQQRVVRQALAAAGRTPGEVGMLEAHGTGTLLGDPIELDALSQVFTPPGTEPAQPRCPIGSVKSNIGHLLSAAGIASVLKTMLSIERGIIPATLWCEHPNPRYDLSRSPFFPNTSVGLWSTEPGHRVAGVSSFGLGGTNAHAVLSDIDDAERCRPGGRCPLPAPVFHRRRLWYGPDTAPQDDPLDGAGPAQARAVASLLDLELVGGPR
jgi:acyl transferase domain-containing protein/acyl carrier protein